MRNLTVIIAAAIAILPQAAWPHGGGLDRFGCHNDRRNGGRHCHNGGGEDSVPSRAISSIRAQPQALIAAPTRRADAFELIRVIQKMLSKAGYLQAPADGVLGPQTIVAIVNFQRDHGLEADGQIDEALTDKLIERLAR